MSNPAAHHYVPQVYLRNFCALYQNQEKLYAYDRLKIDGPIPSKFDQYSTKSVCHAPYLYEIKNSEISDNFNITDNNIVEKEAFKIYENSINDIFQKILSPDVSQRSNRFISTKEATTFIKTLLNMKKRNPFFMSTINKSNTPFRVNESIRADFIINRDKWEEKLHHEGLTIDGVMNKLDELASKPEFAQDMLRVSLYLEGLGKTDNAISEIASLLMTKEWYIFDTTVNDLFITSDNPGYCVNRDGNLFNLNFLDDFIFEFPLSPYHMIRIDNSNNDKIIPPFKGLTYIPADSSLIEQVNRLTVANAYRYVYSNSSLALNKTINQWQSFFGPDSAKGFPK